MTWPCLMLPYLKPHSPCSSMLCLRWPFSESLKGPPPPHRACACPAPLPGKLFSPALPFGCLLCIFTSWLDVPASGQCSRPSTYLRSLWAENPVLFLFNSYLCGYLCNILVLCWAVASMSAGTILLTLSDNLLRKQAFFILSSPQPSGSSVVYTVAQSFPNIMLFPCSLSVVFRCLWDSHTL